MEKKTQIIAEDGKQDMVITREFDLPLALLFKAYVEAKLVEQWMGTRVLHLESKPLGSYRFETTDPKGNAFVFSGCIHNVIQNELIIRTFEMENTAYGVQLEFYRFESLTPDRSKLTMHVVYESVEQRDGILKLPFAQGINMAHNRIQKLFAADTK